MTKNKWTSILLVGLLLGLSISAEAQQEKRFKRGMATIVFSSLGGAILGLSTLSFYGDPEEHANNVSTGAVLGFIVGSSYVLLDSSSSPPPRQDFSKQSENDHLYCRSSWREGSIPPALQIALEF